MRLANKVAVVTGGSSGIGLATAKRFVEEGAYVYITGRRQEELDSAVREIGKNVTAIQGDVAKLADLDRIYAAVKKGHGKLDILFANAGGGTFLPLGQITEEQYENTFNANVKGLLFSVQKALPLLTKTGSIILNASTTGVKGTPAFSVYSATKAAVRNFARSWAMDLKGTGIRVNVISPGPIDTPALDGLFKTDDERKQFRGFLESQVPLGRIGRPEELANAVVFFASDESSFVQGAELFVDGGFAQV